MSSPANKDSADGPKPTARQMEILTLIFQNMRSKPDIDWNSVAEQAKLKSDAVAKEVFRQLQKKLGWNNTNSSAPAGGGSSTPGKVTKRTGKVGDSATKRGRGRPKKAKEVVEEDDEGRDASVPAHTAANADFEEGDAI